MTPYELMIKTNHHLIKGGVLAADQKQNIVSCLLSAKSTEESARRFYRSVKYPNNTDIQGRRMYPVFFIPPYNNGKKFPTVMNQLPQTHILSANSYELEIIRLLYILQPENPAIQHMVVQTLKRLKTTCFGNKDDGLGECFDASLIALRFLGGVAPAETKWIHERIENFRKHFNEKPRRRSVIWYFWLCLSELPLHMAKPEILRWQEDIIRQLGRRYAMNREAGETTLPVATSVMRNVLSRLPEYGYWKKKELSPL